MKALRFGKAVVAVALFRCSVVANAAKPEWNAAGWFVARSPHFECYSQAGEERAKLTLTRFEELRTFFENNRVVNRRGAPERNSPIRIVEFQNSKQYEVVKLHPAADAYYSAASDRDYIVMPTLAANDFSLAAHEYAHAFFHSAGLKLPAWLNEGLAELFSTVTITHAKCELGGGIAARIATLHRFPWTPASELLAEKATEGQSRTGAAVFYAESWAVTDLLAFAPEYAPRFAELVRLLNSGLSSYSALAGVYRKSPEAILADAQNWVRKGGSRRREISPFTQTPIPIEVASVREAQAKMVIADLLYTNGNIDRAEQMYEELLSRSPNDPELLAYVGSTALRRGETQKAAVYWANALEAGLRDATLCYRYALLADDLDLPSAQVEQALERAIAIRPNFDEARFKLALAQSNRGDYASAVNQLKAMTEVPAVRAFGYWTALAYALTELGERHQAEAAAARAKPFAKDAGEYARAAELVYLAQTEMSVQFARDAEGKPKMVTTRVPHGSGGTNPFIEAGDHIERASGTLREVRCTDGRLTEFLVDSGQRTLALAVPDPAHVSIRGGMAEFTCGPQAAVPVKVEYAATAGADQGLLRGMDLSPDQTLR